MQKEELNDQKQPAKFSIKSLQFEQVVGEILKENFDLLDEPFDNNSFRYDFKTINGINIEVKYTAQSDLLSFSRYLRNLTAHNSISELDKTLFVSNVTKGDSSLPNTIINIDGRIFYIITIENLLYLCGDNEKLRQQLVNCLHISTENIVPQPLDKNITGLLSPCKKVIETKSNAAKEESLKELLRKIPTGKQNFNRYEEFCMRLVSTIFRDNIENITEQKVNNHGLYRFDLIASLKEDPKNFWKFIYDKFNSCFILFECKNYGKQITQGEIYSTERYLYNHALRNVAVIFSRKGMNKNAYTACQGILKEHGKLILVLNDEDIINLIDAYNGELINGIIETPSSILFAKTKDFLLNLDK